MADVVVPALGESITSGVINRWNKKVGDPVQVDEPLLSLETDKVTVDVPSPVAGVLSEIVNGEGATVKVGDVVGKVAEGAQATAPEPAPAAARAAPETPPELLESGAFKLLPDAAEESARAVPISPVAKRMAEDRGVDTSLLQGSGPGGRITKEDVMGAPENGAA